MLNKLLNINRLPLWLIMISLLATPSVCGWYITKLTDNNVNDILGGMSADGKKIVYISDVDGNPLTGWDREVFLYDLDTMTSTRITYNIYEDRYAHISGDGSKIAFSEYKKDKYEVYVVDADDSWAQTSPIATFDEKDSSYVPSFIDSSWTVKPLLDADGSHIVVYLCDWVITDKIYTIDANTGKISIIDDKGWDLRMASGGSKSSYLAYHDDDTILYSANSDGSNVKEVYGDKEDKEVEGVWGHWISSDGKVVFKLHTASYVVGGRNGLFIYDGGSIRPLKIGGDLCYPIISGDGSKVVYVNKSDGIHMINSDGSNDKLIMSLPDYLLDSIGGTWFTTPSINYDGSILAVSAPDGQSGDYELYVLSKTPLNKVNTQVNIQLTPVLPPSTIIIFDSGCGVPGKEIQIPVKIKNAKNIGSINLVLEYPSGILEAEDVIPGSLTQNSMIEQNIKDGNISIGIVDSNGITGNGSLVYIKFKIKENPTLPVHNISTYGMDISGKIGASNTIQNKLMLQNDNTYPLFIEESIVNGVNGTPIETLTIDGTFKLISEEKANKGDVNGDGEITSVDALMALQMSVGKLEPDMVADMNDDGKVLANDALEILNIANQKVAEKVISLGKSFGGTPLGLPNH